MPGNAESLKERHQWGRGHASSLPMPAAPTFGLASLISRGASQLCVSSMNSLRAIPEAVFTRGMAGLFENSGTEYGSVELARRRSRRLSRPCRQLYDAIGRSAFCREARAKEAKLGVS
jgi:hypothetical protein